VEWRSRDKKVFSPLQPDGERSRGGYTTVYTVGGLFSVQRPYRVTRREAEFICAVRKMGFSIQDIAFICSRSERTVFKVLDGRGLARDFKIPRRRGRYLPKEVRLRQLRARYVTWMSPGNPWKTAAEAAGMYTLETPPHTPPRKVNSKSGK